MKRFLLLHYGFEQPTEEIMTAWKEWFDAIADINVAHGGLGAGREISRAGVEELPWGRESITGYNIIEADSLEAAVEVAEGNPYIESIRVYEIRDS